jgi:hypothetical protein
VTLEPSSFVSFFKNDGIDCLDCRAVKAEKREGELIGWCSLLGQHKLAFHVFDVRTTRLRERNVVENRSSSIWIRIYLQYLFKVLLLLGLDGLVFVLNDLGEGFLPK